ncbi:fumarylacetoacetate hydrolase family protein [Oceanobacillus senegalensis]|uniref:fumarylacetoacetate hydrolase family protein n=1 Tax=Oceanobacillus senegalensis TaxID=1936063 RepID=UPI000A3116C1|nr:fumarylacetoacetate hydrolase family protein [Oceanobacillus senegalensis]
MKLANYIFKGKPGRSRIGFIHNDRIVDIQESYQRYLVNSGENNLANDVEYILPSNPEVFFSRGLNILDEVEKAYNYAQEGEVDSYSLDEVRLETPNPNPSKIICVGKNYEEHVAEVDSDLPDHPVLFAKFNNALIGPEDDIEKPKDTKQYDYEVELGIVIGKEATKVSRVNAYEYISGYTIGNDISARDLQFRTQEWLQGKTLDNSTPVGPWVVTKDEIGDPTNLSIRALVNGEERQSSNTKFMIFDIPYLMEYITNLITLKPGDIILTGTPEGVGLGMNPPGFINDGDMVTLEIENIGKMENRVIEK